MLALPTVQAADIKRNDSCPLADDIVAANTDAGVGGCQAGDGADTITLSSNITLDAALPHITSEITIVGEDMTISGNNRFRIFANNGGSLAVNNLTMTDGFADWGGAIVNVNGGTLAIKNSELSRNRASEGGAIGNNSHVQIVDTTMEDNSGEDGGAVYDVEGTVRISNSTILRNNADRHGGAIFVKLGRITIVDSSIGR